MEIKIHLSRERIRDNILGVMATVGCCGLIPFRPDILATLAGAFIWYLIHPRSVEAQFWLISLLYIIGYLSAHEAEDWWGQDDRRVVVDEMAGIWLALWSFEKNLWIYAIGVALFLLINLIKFYPAMVCHRWGRGFGVMMEKAVVGAYAGILLSVAALFFSKFPLYQVLFARLAVYGTVLLAAMAAHIYGSVRGGLRVLAIALGAYLFYRWSPYGLWGQLALIWIPGLVMLAATYALGSHLERWRSVFEYLFVFWGTWAALWSLPKMPILYILAVPIIIICRYLRPLPANYLPPWKSGTTILAVNLISAAYASTILQVGVMMFLPGAIVFVKYIALKLSGLIISIIH